MLYIQCYFVYSDDFYKTFRVVTTAKLTKGKREKQKEKLRERNRVGKNWEERRGEEQYEVWDGRNIKKNVFNENI